jgi:hypothetical protein
VGLPLKEGEAHLHKLFENKRLKIVDNKIYTTDVDEIVKQAEYYKKMQRIERSRREGSKMH